MNDHKVKSVVKSLSKIQDKNFFNEICISLSRAIDADFVFIATLDDEKTVSTTIALTHNGLITENFSYDLQYTPCSEVANESVCCYRDNIQRLYPNDQLLVDMNIEGYVGIPLKNNAGHVDAILVALFEENIENIHDVETLFLLFSGLIEKELHKSKYLKEIEFSNTIINNTHDAIFICDKNLAITYVNPSFTRVTGYSEADIKGKKPNILQSGRQDNIFYRAMWADINNKGHWNGEIWNKNKDGSEYLQWVSITAMLDEHNEVINYIAFFMDITEQHLAKEKIRFQDSFDILTKSPNRKSLFEFIEHSLTEQKYLPDNTESAALLIIDIDLFKKFNSLYSHSFGDKVLIYVANKLHSLKRGSDFLARISGDNYALFVNDLGNKDDVIHIIKSISQAFKAPFVIDDIRLKLTFSIGVAYLNKDATDAHGLFEKAEQAMFMAKDSSCNSFGFYNQLISDKAAKEQALQMALESAIENDEFSVVYQPVVSLETQSTVKFEALVRWHTEGKWISPVEFIPAAEKFGLISKIGRIVLNKACIELKKLKEQGFTDIVFNVNRSIYEFPLESEDTQWLDTIEKYGLSPEDICFELTESALAPENENCIGLLSNLQKAGCTIALDDFGTGYSSLSYLRRFPVNSLKIDRSFISDMTKVEGDIVLVSAIISMAKALDIKVVAEGVELKEEVNILTDLGCDFIQGYYFSKPISPELLLPYLKEFKYPK